MLKEVLASNVAKLVAACVCPLAGASAIALKVPQVRAAVHKATEPKTARAKPKLKQPPQDREARAKPRVRMPVRPAIAPEAGGEQLAQGMMCPSPVQLGPDLPIGAGSSQQTVMVLPAPAPVIEVQRNLQVVCPSIGGGMALVTAATGVVPEPATWAQMIAGFALVGGTLRAGRQRRLREHHA